MNPPDPDSIQDPAASDAGSEPSVQGVEERLASVGTELRQTIGDVLGALPGAPHRATDLARELRLNKDASSRVVRAVRQQDPVAVAHLIPGPEPLGRLLDAAERMRVEPKVVSDARAAVHRFAELIANEAGDRGSLDAIISAWLPEAREKHELMAKQTVYRGMSLARGMSCEASVNLMALWPSDRREHFLDALAVMGTLGLRRFNDQARLTIASWTSQVDQPLERLTLDGQPAGSPNDLRLDGFCSEPLMDYEAHESENAVAYTVTPADVGLGASMDTVIAELQRDSMMRVRPPGSRGDGDAFVSGEVTVPTRVFVLDVLVHRDVFVGSEPRVVVYDMAVRGFADVNDRSRDLDRYALTERVQACGRGVSGLRLTEAPRYVEMVESALGRVGWEADGFRAYRCRVEYPICGSQVCVIFPRKSV